MIYKAFETNKINLEINNILLLYGRNDGAKNEEISRILEKNKSSEILRYNETEILSNDNLIFENVLYPQIDLIPNPRELVHQLHQ